MNQYTTDPSVPVTFTTETVSISREDLIRGHHSQAEVAREYPGHYTTDSAMDTQSLMPAVRLLADLYLNSIEKGMTAR